MDEYKDLTNEYRNGNLSQKIQEIKNNQKIAKIKICINYDKITNSDFSQIDDLIIYFPFDFKSEYIPIQDCKFKKLAIQNFKKSFPIKNINYIRFLNCKFEEKIIINLNSFIRLSRLEFISEDREQISLDLIGPDYPSVNLNLENINLINSNFECDVELKSNTHIDIRGCSFSEPLTIAGNNEYCFNNIEDPDDPTKNKNTEFDSIELKENCQVKITGCEEIEDIFLSGDANTLELSHCKKIFYLEANKNSRIIINKGLELHKKNPKNSKESDYFTTIFAIDISEGGNFLHLVNCEIEHTYNLAGDFESGFILDNVKFLNAPTIGNVAFKNCNVEIRDVEFEDKKTSKAIAGFRALNQACHKANHEMGVIFFHGLELEARYNSHLKNIDFKHRDYPEKILSYLNKNFTDYGRNLSSPICYNLILSIIFFFFAIIFVPIDAAKLAFHNFLGPMEHLAGKDFVCPKFYNSLPFLLKAFSFINKLFSYGIWIVWFFMIRRRFKI